MLTQTAKTNGNTIKFRAQAITILTRKKSQVVQTVGYHAAKNGFLLQKPVARSVEEKKGASKQKVLGWRSVWSLHEQTKKQKNNDSDEASSCRSNIT